MRKCLLRGVLFAAAALYPLLSSAQSFETISIEVRYADLDLSTAQGFERLHARARQAITQACGSASDGRYLQVAKLADACRASARELIDREIMALMDRTRAQQASTDASPIRIVATYRR
jgi:UrcA family protein